MAGKALAAFSLLATLLQVRAQFNCYPNYLCGTDGSIPTEVSSAMECCLRNLSMALSYAPTGSTDCQKCYVIGFESETLRLNEDGSNSEKGDINLFILYPPDGGSDELSITFQINEMLSTATFGVDYTLDGFNQTTRMITEDADQEISISIGVNDDNTPGEEDNFVLEITSAQVIPDGTVDLVNVFVNNSLTVFIVEDDVIQVEFGRSEYDIDEEMLTQDITFTISNAINEDTYFYVQALTYEQYDDLYPTLNETYRHIHDVPTSTLDQEYDQAELEDFKSRIIPFTIKANTDFIEGTVTIEVVDDNMLEPFSEGFRLVILVNETMTPLSYVGFGTGRQVALFRIDDRQDKFQFGFMNEFLRITETPGTTQISLPLYVAVNNTTEYTIGITFTDTGSTATRGEDYEQFAGGYKIVPPAMITPMTFFDLTILKHDQRFEPEETIVVNVGNIELEPIPPYDPRHDTAETVMSTVIPPDIQTRIIRNLTKTTVIIEAGGILTVYLHVPEVVREGESFTRNVSASDLVQGQFRVFNSPGTAMLVQDYSGGTGRVSFADSTSADGGEVEIIADNLVEPNETFTVNVRLSSPDELEPFLVIENSPQVVTILDSNTATIGFRDMTLSVNESAGEAVLTVAVLGEERLADNAEVRVSFSTLTGTADSQDFISVTVMELVFNGTQQEINVAVTIIDDTVFEDPETFTAFLTLLSSNVNAKVNPSLATVTINDNDVPSRLECILSDSLNLQTFSNQVVNGHSFSIAEGCEHKLVMTCDEDVVDLEIRVDYFQNDFNSSRIAIVYEGEVVIIDEDLNLIPGVSPLTEIVYQPDTNTNMVSVLIPEIKLEVTRNLVALTVSLGNTTLPLAGLCGDLTGQLLFPDCARTADSGPGADLSPFKESYKLKPSDQILRGERKECGITVNDTVIGDPLLTVPIYAPGNPSDLHHLCYEIHGAADQYFNFISDECTSVNAHYVQAPGADFLNIIDSMSFVAVDNEHICRRISVDVANCSASVDGVDLPPMSRKRSISTYEENGISVRAYQTRVRVSVPNCADNSLVMWVFCQKQSFLNPYNESEEIGPIDMIKFEVTRGFNLKESSHGLLGQFWNIPMNISEYEGKENYYIVTISHPSSEPRSFAGHLYPLTWEFEFKDCLYVGNRQGGPIAEVDDPNDSVIEGIYQDYVTQGSFMTNYKYAVFDESLCK